MKKFFQSGAAFVVVALLCLAASLTSKGRAFTGVGMVFLILAVAVRSKYAKKAPPEKKS